MVYQIQKRRDTAANWASNNPVLAQGEEGFETDIKRIKIGDGITAWNSLLYTDTTYEQINNRIYAGVDLSVKFVTEIAGYTDVWAWIKARIQAGNFTGIHIGDYIPFTMNAGTVTDGTTPYTFSSQSMQAQIAGIDTYYGYGDTALGHHIDFITKTVVNTAIPWQPNNNNNATSVNAHPWLTSKLYAILNGVNNYTTSAYNSVAHGYALSSGSVLSLLPSALQNVIINKKQLVETRYSASGLLTSSPGWNWSNMGKLWLPNEFEVYGSPVWSAQDYANGNVIQYPIFAGSNSKIKTNSSGTRTLWWLSVVFDGDYISSCVVANTGGAYYYACSNSTVNIPICFRIA